MIRPTKKSESPNFVWMRHWIRSCHSLFSYWNSLKYFVESFLTFLKLLTIKLLFGFQEKLLLLLIKHRLADKHPNYSSWSKVLWKIFDIWKIMQNILYSSTKCGDMEVRKYIFQEQNLQKKELLSLRHGKMKNMKKK